MERNKAEGLVIRRWFRSSRLAGLVVLFCLLLGVEFALASLSEAAVRKAPYLIYRGANTEMQILWQLSASQVCTIEWGADQSYSLGSVQTNEYGLDHQHTYTIPNLLPGTMCYYRVTAGAEQYAGAFRAAPPGAAVKVKFLAYGDTRSYPADHDRVAARIVAHYTADPDLQTFILSVADLVYNGDLETDWDNQFFSSLYPNIRTMLAGLPYQSAMGNHERTGVGFMKYFPYPYVAGRYWSFDYGPTHFAVVDQYTPYSTGTDQLVWLENDLASTTKPWKFVCLHEPGWSAGGGHGNNTSVQTYIQPLCQAYDVAAVFGGHNHYYARASVNGVEHVTAGGGGAPLHTPNLTYPYVVTGTSAYSHCEVAIDGGYLTLRAYTHADSLIDSLAISLPGAGVTGVVGHEVRPGLDLVSASANPVEGETVFWFSIPVAARAELAVYGIGGQKVRTLVDEQVGGGSHRAAWDGEDESGRRVPPGMYFIHLRAAGGGVAKKIVVTE